MHCRNDRISTCALFIPSVKVFALGIVDTLFLLLKSSSETVLKECCISKDLFKFCSDKQLLDDDMLLKYLVFSLLKTKKGFSKSN